VVKDGRAMYADIRPDQFLLLCRPTATNGSSADVGVGNNDDESMTTTTLRVACADTVLQIQYF
jgi:hypothetical protein